MTTQCIKNKSPDLASIKSLYCSTIITSCNTILDATSQTYVQISFFLKTLLHYDKNAADLWKRKPTSSSNVGKIHNRIFGGFFINEPLSIDRTCVPGEEIFCSDVISHLNKASLTSVNFHLWTFPFLESYRHYHLLQDLSLKIFNLIATASEELLEYAWL